MSPDGKTCLLNNDMHLFGVHGHHLVDVVVEPMSPLLERVSIVYAHVVQAL